VNPFAEARDEFGTETEEFSNGREGYRNNRPPQDYQRQEFVREEVFQRSREVRLEQSFQQISVETVIPAPQLI
jgi:hypothetical protein